MNNFYKHLFVILIFLQICDGTLTYIGVSRHGVGIEGNPLIAFILEQCGYGFGLFFVKLIACILINWVYKKIEKREFRMNKIFDGILISVTGLYVYVVGVWVYALAHIL